MKTADRRHLAAIHVLKAQLKLSDDDYRALLRQLAGVDSAKALTDRQRAAVRDHLQRLAERMGVATTRKRPYTAERFAAKKDQATPRERKVWALWHQLHRDGAISDNSPAALNAWVARTVHVDALVWCDDLMLNTLIEALKVWCERAADARAAARARAAATQG